MAPRGQNSLVCWHCNPWSCRGFQRWDPWGPPPAACRLEAGGGGGSSQGPDWGGTNVTSEVPVSVYLKPYMRRL